MSMVHPADITGIIMTCYLVGLPIISIIIYCIKTQHFGKARGKVSVVLIIVNCAFAACLLTGLFTFKFTRGLTMALISLPIIYKFPVYFYNNLEL